MAEELLRQSVRWGEHYVSRALNVKFAGIIPPGVYHGFELAPGGHMKVLVNNDQEYGRSVAVVERDDYSLTIIMDDSQTVDIPAPGEWFICVEAFYAPAQSGYQRLVARENVESHHVVLGKVSVASEANITSDMISYTGRQQRAIPTQEKVSKSGDMMTGALSFVHNSCTFINLKNTDANRDNYYQETFWSGLDFSDKNGKPTGGIAHICNDHEVYTNLTCVTSEGVTCAMGLILPKDGTPYILGYEPPLTDNSRKLASTSFVNKKLGSATSVAALAALNEQGEDYEETLETKKLKAIAALNAEASQAIYAGFPYEIDGADYMISYSLFDQQNLADQAIIAAANPEETFAISVRDEDGEERELELSGQAVANLHAYGARLKFDILRSVRVKKKRIMAATSEEEIKAIYME